MTKKCHENSGGYALCLLYACEYRIQNTEILLSMNNIEICLTTA